MRFVRKYKNLKKSTPQALEKLRQYGIPKAKFLKSDSNEERETKTVRALSHIHLDSQ